MNTRLLTVFGVVDIVIGVLAWLAFGSPAVGLALVAAGIAVLVVAALRNRGEDDPDAALRNQRADQQRQAGETRASTENAEDRPPPSGG